MAGRQQVQARAEGEPLSASRPAARSVRSFARFCLPAFLPFCLAAVLFSSCTRTQAKVTPDGPLEVPAPPPREVDTTEAEPPAPIPLVEEPARNTPQRLRPTPPPQQPRVESPKPEPPAPPTPPAEAPKPAEEPKPPATTLQTTPSTGEVDLERGIRATITKATADLNRIDYRVLNNDARTQYDTAKRFIRQAEENIRSKNLVFAKSLADKAVVIAAQLSGR
jgi:outer membrane biosynthesis protein TonB